VSDGGEQARMAVLEAAWGDLVAWCVAHAPATAAALRGPADESAIRAAQEEMGAAWPGELVAWLRRNDGAGRSWAGVVLPFYVPLGVDDILKTWRMLTDISAQLVDPGELAIAEAAAAGTPSIVFLRSWVPIASDYCGSHYFVDLRHGKLHGCVGEFLDADGFTREPLWPDLAAMVTDVLDAVRSARLVAGWQPHADDGVLRWNPAPAPPRAPDSLDDLRARLLLYGDRRTADEIADRLGLPSEIVTKWRVRFINDCPFGSWDEIVESTPPGRLVRGEVFSSHPFGVYVDIGEPFPAALDASHMRDGDQPAEPGEYPAAGSIIAAVVLNHDRTIGQIWIDARPSSLHAAGTSD
jgi:cell wall assembly regulator SMI1